MDVAGTLGKAWKSQQHRADLAKKYGPDYRKVPVGGTVYRVETYKGEKELQRGLQTMRNEGWTVDEQASRKALYSLAAAVFTRKQIHTVTYTRIREDD